MKQDLCILLVVTILNSCNQDKNVELIIFDSLYQGLWAETMWEYRFKKDGTFIFKTQGHYDNSITTGTYAIKKKVLLLNPNSDWMTLDGVLKTRLKVISDECIRDFDNYYYCTSTDSINHYIVSNYSYKEFVFPIMDNLPIVKEAKSKINFKYDDYEPKMYYEGIIVDNSVELHRYSLVNFEEDDNRFYLTLLVQKKPFKIFEYDSKGDNLTLVYER